MKDLDLLEISGLIAYGKYSIDYSINVNGTKYIVEDITDNKNGNGLQAMTLKNTVTKEYVIAYQGTKDSEDIFADLSLASGTIPLQFEDARQYYKEMKEKYNIKYVCGNSLGGGLANYVAINHPEVNSVTYNPAILPVEIFSIIKFKNIKNYLGENDPLTILELAVGYNDKIPGEIIMTHDNIPSIAFLITNHVGYNHENEININGGNVPIRVNLLNGLPFSVFTKDYLEYNYSGNGEKISINEESMQLLKNGVIKLNANVSYAQRYLDESLRIIRNEGSMLYNRIDELNAKNDEVFKLLGIDILKIVDDIETALNDMNPVLRTLYDIVGK